MLQRLVVILFLLHCYGLVSAQTITEYEYWIDDNLANRTNVKSSNTSVNLTIDLKDMQTGIHYLSFRAKNSDGNWGSFSRFIFFAPEKKDTNIAIQDYQYWLDDDFVNKVTVKGDSNPIQARLNITTLSSGVHYFNFRAKNSSGDWGALTRYIFVVQEPHDPNVKINEYEYWIDDNFECKVSVRTSSTNIPFTVDISKLSGGTHYLNFRAKNSEGIWGALTRYQFMAQSKNEDNVKIKTYEYWVDDDFDKKKLINTSQTNIQFSINIADLTEGVHYLNFRAQNSNGDWGTLTRYIFVVQERHDPNVKINEYEYWIDDNFDAKVSIKTSSTDIPFTVDISKLSEGTHYLNFRARNSDGVWGALSRYSFMAHPKVEENVEVKMYEYWVDDDFSNIKRVSTSQTNIQFSINIQGLTEGVHYLNFRALNTLNIWGTLTRYIFVVKEPNDPNVKINEYEYWIDDNFDAKELVKTSSTDIPFTVDISKLSGGIHYLNFRAKNSEGIWGALTRYHFTAQPKQEENVSIKMYEYWIDDDFANMKCVNSSQTNIQFSVNMENLTDGVHYLNFRALNTSNTWGALTRYIFLKSKETNTSKSPIIAYRYSFGGASTYVNVSPSNDLKLENLKIPIPSSSEYGTIDENCQFTFSGDQVKMVRGSYVNFNIQFLNQAEAWSVPYCHSMYLTDIIEHQANTLDLQSSVTYGKTSQGDYFAFKSTIPKAGTYYFKTSQPCKIDLYKPDGTLEKTFSSNDLLDIASVNLSQGIYYGIVHSTATSEQYDNDKVTVRLMVTNQCVPTPTISFSNGKVTIGCLQNGALIYYTVNGEDPTSQSSQYIGPFDVLRNCTIKAFATYEDLEPSDIATYKVNSYKVEKPIITFANLQFYMTCSTPNSEIFFTMDGKDPDIYGKKYIEPVKVSSSCTVQAIAKRGGYNNSDITTYIYDESSVTCPTPSISFSNGIVTISCLQDGTSIYYTTNGTIPTISSTLYNGAFNIEENCTIKAIAVYEGFLDSAVAEYQVDSFKVATPDITFANLQIHITCSTSNSSIYYTLDDSNPNTNGLLYTNPISIEQNCTVKAIAKRINYHNSDVVTYYVDTDSYICPTPTFSLINNTLKIECLEPGCKIHYTVDGTTPTSASAVYIGPIKLEHNSVIKAYAEKYGYYNSEVASYTVDWFQAEIPSFNLKEDYLTISSSTPGSKIYYTFDDTEPTESSTLYTSPILLIDNRQIKARTYAENFKPSDVAIYNTNSFTCEAATVTYDGRYVSLATTTQSAKIYYTTDGSNPSTKSCEYNSSFDIGDICTLRAIVVKEAMNNSNVISFSIPSYFNGKTLTVDEYGTASNAFEWCDKSDITRLTVLGKINSKDIAELVSLPNLAHLDMGNVSIRNNSLEDNAFANTSLISIQLPPDLQSIGKDIFNGCSRLAAIVWKANMTLSSASINGIKNPNLLLYVRMKSMAPSSIRNVIVNNVADNIVLSDENGVADFYCPIKFLAKHISYSHQYTQRTIVDICAGWETLALPFDVKSIRHSRMGEIVPFEAHNTEAKPFWLYALTWAGFEPSATIYANTPYIISMPNNDNYADDYILAGEITFSADNVYVPITTPIIATKGDISFVPSMSKVDKDTNVYAINKHEVYEGHPEGSMFVSDLRDLNPFEAYLTFDYSSPTQLKALGIFDLNDFSYDIPVIASKHPDFKVYVIDDVLYIETRRAQRVDIFNINGMLIRSLEVEDGVTRVEDLAKGLYLVRNNKVLFK